jgi:hypothetical protein
VVALLLHGAAARAEVVSEGSKPTPARSKKVAAPKVHLEFDFGARLDAAPTAVMPPAPADAPWLPTEPMLGPYPTFDAYCSALASAGSGRCERKRGYFARGWTRGRRGPFLSATTWAVERKLGAHTFGTCHIALQTERGWYVSASTTSCSGPGASGLRTTELEGLHWLDRFGFGVLAARTSQQRRARIEERRWWGQMYTESDIWEAQTMLCGMALSGVPACTAALATQCQSGAQPLNYLEQPLRIESTASAETVAACGGQTLPKGNYSWPFSTAPSHYRAPPAEEIQPLVAPTRAATDNTLPLIGPFSSLREYCADPPTFMGVFDEGLSLEGEQPSLDEASGESPATPYVKVPDPLLLEPRCERRVGRWNTRQLHGKGPVLAVQLLRKTGDFAGADVEYCHIAITTHAGVFVSDPGGTCQGVIGPDVEITTRVLALSWLEPKTHNAFRIDLETQVHSTARSALLCGVGPSGVPSCSPPYPLQCQGAETPSGLSLDFDGAFVHLTQTGKPLPDDMQSYEDCDQYAQPLPLVFP